MTIDFEGNVQLCCGTYDSRRFTLGKYLALPLEDLQRKKYAHDMCGRCMQRGVHVYGTYGGPDFDAIAERTIGPDNARLLRLTAERRRKRIRRGVEWLHRQTAGRCLSSEQSAWLASATSVWNARSFGQEQRSSNPSRPGRAPDSQAAV